MLSRASSGTPLQVAPSQTRSTAAAASRTTGSPTTDSLPNGASAASAAAAIVAEAHAGAHDAAARSAGAPMNVIIPMGGIGSRFSKSGYRYPKPLINIVGRPMLFWLIENLKFAPGDILWLAMMRSVDEEFQLGAQVKREFKHIDVRVVLLDFETRGASETLFIVCQNMDDEALARPTVSLDCDTIYFDDVLTLARTLPPRASACVYFEDKGTDPVFSYIALDQQQQRITAIREKVAISRNANTGAYVFGSGELLHTYTCETLDAGVGAAGEYFTSSVIARMVERGEPFLGRKVSVDGFCCVGTPSQLDAFLKVVLARPHLVKKRRFCFDLDNTLVTMPRVEGDYSTCEPKHRNIQLLRQLKAAGHYVIIQTARRMRTHNGNVGAVIRDVGAVTIQQLQDFGIEYDEIHFGKPWAHLYIDDLAVNALLDTGKEIGWYMPNEKSAAASAGRQEATVRARDFNRIQYVGDKVIKTSQSSTIHGEAYFYAHLPDDVAHLFPRLHDLDYNPENETTSITIASISGITFSHLLASRCLTPGRFRVLLEALHALHMSNGERGNGAFELAADVRDAAPWVGGAASSAASPVVGAGAEAKKVDVGLAYANYLPKAASRLAQYAKVYRKLGICPEAALASIRDHFERYEREGNAIACRVIHGDPVFSNVLMTKDSHVKFIDMRGRLGNSFTVAGDAMYDLAKVYQSLCGYDYIILGRELGDADLRELARLKDVFWAWVAEHYVPLAAAARSGKNQDDHSGFLGLRANITAITALLVLTLIPLHSDPEHHAQFVELFAAIAADAGLDAALPMKSAAETTKHLAKVRPADIYEPAVSQV